MFEGGYLTIGRWQGTALRLHWSTPLGLLFFGGGAFAPGAWLGVLAVIVAHEAGHALLARQQRLHPHSIDVHAIGGQCRYGGAALSTWQRSVVAWGGVLAQAVILVPALLVERLVAPSGWFVEQLLYALVRVNLVILAFNLLPIPPLDGGDAWKLPGLWWRRRKLDAPQRSHRPRSGDDVLDLEGVDQEAVRETVRRALREAARKDTQH